MDDRALAVLAARNRESAELRAALIRNQGERLQAAALRTALCLARGGKVLWCGDGESLPLVRSLAATLLHGSATERPALPSLALDADVRAPTAGHMTDASVEDPVSWPARQVEGLGRRGDMLVLLSRTGNDIVPLSAALAGRQGGLVTLGVSGENGELLSHCDMSVAISAAPAELVQEALFAVGHMFCQLSEYYLFENAAALRPLLEAPSQPEV